MLQICVKFTSVNLILSLQERENKTLCSVNAYAPGGSLSILPVHESKVAHCDGTNEYMQTNILGFEVHTFISYETVQMSKPRKLHI